MYSKEARRLWRAIYRKLNDPNWKIKLRDIDRDVWGECWSDGQIDLCMDCPLLPVGIHELVHAAYPDMNHKDVYKAQHLLMREVTVRQAKAFLKRLMDVLG